MSSRTLAVMATSSRALLPLLCLVLLNTGTYEACKSCPGLTKIGDPGGREIPNSHGSGENASEFLCLAKWNRERMRRKVKFMLKDEEKKFIRFRTPVQSYSNPRLGLNNWDGVMTWIWATDQFDYMLYYPQNFQTLSLGTTDIIVANMDDDDIRIDCSHCSKGTSCGIGYFELKELISNVSDPLGMEEWEYLCLEADIGVSDIVTDYPPEQSLSMLNTRNFALPDILYQSRFLKLLFTKCPFLTFDCEEVRNYYCYSLKKNCVVKELLSRYNVVVYLALALWLYCPILVFYLPSSRRTYSLKYVSEMFPTYKSPVYFGRCIQDLLCYHTAVTGRRSKFLIRLRRFLALIGFAFLSFRLLILPEYQLISWTILTLFIFAALQPEYLSTYINPEIPRHFPFFSTPYPPGVIKWGSSQANSIEFQKLSYIMVERIYVTTDTKFWVYLVQNSFSYMIQFYSQPSSPPLWFCKVFFSALAGIITLSLSVATVLVYFLIPMPYFIKELFLAIHSGVYKHCSDIWKFQGIGKVWKLFSILLSFSHGAVLCTLLLYFILTLFSLCYLLTEVTMFTYMGATIAADKVLHYFILIVAVATAVYTMIHAIHKQYSGILKDTAFLLENDVDFDHIKAKLSKKKMKVIIEKTDQCVLIKGVPPSQFSQKLYLKEEYVNYMNSRMYFFIVESIQPIRRQVLLLVVKLFLMVFFIVVSMSVKNVYKTESKVEDIFNVASSMAVYFVPAALQLCSGQSQFGRRTDAQQRIDIVSAIVKYIKIQSNRI